MPASLFNTPLALDATGAAAAFEMSRAQCLTHAAPPGGRRHEFEFSQSNLSPRGIGGREGQG